MFFQLFTIAILSVSVVAEASILAPKVALTVGRADLTPVGRRDCEELHELVNWASLRAEGAAFEADCRIRQDGFKFSDRASGRYGLHFQIEHLLGNGMRLRVENWANDGSEFDHAAWEISGAQGEDEARLQVQQALRRFFGYYHHRDKLVAAATRANGGVRPERHGLRALSEIGAAMGLVGGIYYFTPGAQDNLDNSILNGLKSKATSLERYRTDDNRLLTNGISHGAFTAPLFYLGARNNGFNAFESFLFNFTASAFWEFAVEAREVFSLSDQVFTPFAGTTFAEVLFQFRRLFERGRPNATHRVLKNVFGAHTWWHRFFGTKPAPQATEVDSRGLPVDNWHEVGVYVGGERAPDESFLASAGIRGELFTLPEYQKAGETSGWKSDTVYSRLDLDTIFGPEGAAEIALYAKVALAGYYRQKLEKTPSGSLKGYSFLVAPTSGFDLRFDRFPGTDKDEYGLVNILGPTIDLSIYRAGFKIRAVIDAYADFAQIRSLAWGEHKLTMQDPQTTKAILWKRDNYYSLGTTHQERFTVSHSGVEVGAEFRSHRFSSIEGLDANQPAITDDFHLEDRRGSREAWGSYTFPGERVKITAGWQQRSRDGSIRELSKEERFSRLYGRLAILF